MNRDELQAMISNYSRPAKRSTAHGRPAHRTVKPAPKLGVSGHGSPDDRDFTERPVAAHGLTSYRYKGRYGWIMIGAKSHKDALQAAQRSTDISVTMKNLQVWDGTSYVPATDIPTPKSQPTSRLRTDDMEWVTMPLQLRFRATDKPRELFEYKGLRIGQDPFIAIRDDGPQGTSTHFHIYDIRNGVEAGRAHGTRADIYRSLKRALQDSVERLERERQHAIYETEKTRKEEEQQKRDHEDNHGPGLYILPYYSIPELAGKDESTDDLCGDKEGDALGPFHRDIGNRIDSLEVPISIAEDQAGIRSLEDIENLYWELWKKLPPKHKPFILIEAASRKDALARRGYIWISDGLEKGPPVDPRQTGFLWSK